MEFPSFSKCDTIEGDVIDGQRCPACMACDELKFCICHAGMPICASKVNRHMSVGRVNLWADRCVILARQGAYQAACNDFQEQASFRDHEQTASGIPV